MANIRYFRGGFNGGEVTPEFFGRVNDEKFQSGAAKMENFIALPHGPARNRPGLRYVDTVKTSGARIIRFAYSTSQQFVIEMGAGYFRFYNDGTQIVSGSNPYEISNPYAAADLFDIDFVQSGDVLTLVHPKYPPKELRRYGNTNWVLSTITFQPSITAPTGVTVVATSTDTDRSYTYVVTAVDGNGEESVQSTAVTVSGNLANTGAYNTVSWTAVTGAEKYKVYKKSSGVFGYIGVTAGTSFVDDYITANISKVPPEYDISFNSTGNYPRCVTYYEQRRVFAGTNNQPQTVWMTKTGTESNMSIPIVTSDDDAIEVTVATRDANTIQQIVPLSSLIALTSSTELVISGGSAGITQSNISIKPQSYVGASKVKAQIANNIMLYVAGRGNHVRELGYNWQANGMVTGDLSLRAPHLFDGKKIVDMALSSSPYQILWCVVDSGELLGFTYIPEESIGAWHVHRTDGKFKSCCVVTEGNDDRLYVVVERTIGGSTVQYIECMSDMLVNNLEDSFFVDCGVTYTSQTAVTTISGLSWLNGKTVSILADGAVMNQQTVTNGAITLEHAAKKVQIGLPYTSTLVTLPTLGNFESGYGTGRPMAINNVWMRVYHSSGVFAGQYGERLTEHKQRTMEQPGSPPAWKDDEIEVQPRGAWKKGAQVEIRQEAPLPLTVVSITTEVSIGG